MVTDPIADLLTRIRNGVAARHTQIELPYSRLKENVLKILKNEGYIADVEVEKAEKDEGFPKLIISFNDQSKTMSLRRISKPGQRIYRACEKIAKVNSGFGIAIMSTPKGVMTGKEARKQKLGGELLCEIY